MASFVVNKYVNKISTIMDLGWLPIKEHRDFSLLFGLPIESKLVRGCWSENFNATPKRYQSGRGSGPFQTLSRRYHPKAHMQTTFQSVILRKP